MVRKGVGAAFSRWCISLTLILILQAPAWAVPGSSLDYIPPDHWSYRAFFRLASLGLLPLSTGLARPITRLEGERLFHEAMLNLRGANPLVVRLVEEDLRQLAAEFSTDAPFEAVVGGAASSGVSPRLAADRPSGASSVSLKYALTSKLLVYGRAVAGGPREAPGAELYGSFKLGSVLGQLGRTSLWWGPSFRGSLLLSDNAGPLPALRFTTELPRGLLTKIIVPLERSSISPSRPIFLFGTRLDWLPIPRLRIGLSEVVLTDVGPLTPYHLLNPLPVLLGHVASFDLHEALGQLHNTLVAVEGDWIVRPGIRLYATLLIDDLPLWFPGALGFQGGIYLADPFKTGRTDLRVEYSAVTNRTYSYGNQLDYTYMGRSLGHWLGPDGDDLYVELNHRLDSVRILQLSYAYTRKGQGYIGQMWASLEDLRRDWFLSGVVESRHTLGLKLVQFYSPALAARYRIELSSVTNRGNVFGASGIEGLFAMDVAYRWPLSVAPAAPPAQVGSRLPEHLPFMFAPSHLELRAWPVLVTSRGTLVGPPQGLSFAGIGYRASRSPYELSLMYDGDFTGGHALWGIDFHYRPLPELTSGAFTAFAGWGGARYRGELGGAVRTATATGLRLGADFRYQLTINNAVTPVEFNGHVALGGLWPTTDGTEAFKSNIWSYSLGVGWYVRPDMTVEAGYRGGVWWWKPGLPDYTILRWDGFYVGVSLRR